MCSEPLDLLLQCGVCGEVCRKCVVSPRRFMHDPLAPQPQLHYRDDARDLKALASGL